MIFKHTWLNVLAFSLIAVGLAIMIEQTPDQPKEPLLPWLIEVSPLGHTKVLGITLKESTLKEIQDTFSREGVITLFKSPEGDYTLEVYFERMFLNGLRANILISLDITEQQGKDMFQAGARMSELGDGTKKISLNSDSLTMIESYKPYLITYLPHAQLDQEIIRKRFGEPEKIITETSGAVHWLYPSKGLDITYHDKEKEVFQYISPAEFDKIMQPLLQIKELPQADAPVPEIPVS